MSDNKIQVDGGGGWVAIAELAELHTIIQAIQYEREKGNKV